MIKEMSTSVQEAIVYCPVCLSAVYKLVNHCVEPGKVHLNTAKGKLLD